MIPLTERQAERRRQREDRERQADLRARLDAMTVERGRRERIAHVERRLEGLRRERDDALRKHETRLRLELHHALAALEAARGRRRVHPLAPHAVQGAPADPRVIEEAETVVAMIRAELEAATPRPAA